MKSLIFASLLVSTIAIASPKPVACGTHEQNIANNAQDLFNQGALSKLELLRAQIANSKAQTACGNISQADACKDESAKANAMIDTTQDSINKGDLEPIELDRIIVELTKAIAPCSL